MSQMLGIVLTMIAGPGNGRPVQSDLMGPGDTPSEQGQLTVVERTGQNDNDNDNRLLYRS